MKSTTEANAQRPHSLQRVMSTLEPDEVTWLDTTVARLKSVRRRTNKSEMVRLGLSVLRQRDPDELRELLRQLD